MVEKHYPLPFISGLCDQLGQAKMSTKIDLQGAYNLVCIKKFDEWKMAFHTRYDHFEYNVMHFRFTNNLAIFHHIMNDTFREYLDDFVVCYLNNILVYSKNEAWHEKHVPLLLQKLCNALLNAKLKKLM